MTSLLTHLLFREGGGVDVGMMWNVVAGLSLLWIVYRVFLVFRKPTEELEEILGIDIPPVPEVTLSSIASDTVLLYWKSPENYYSPLTLAVQVNGVNAAFTRSEATIKITGLQPGCRYGIRVVTTNTAGNSSYSPLIQLQTSQQGGHYGSKLLQNLQAQPRRVSSARRYSQPPVPSRSQDPLHAETESKLKRRLDILRRDEEDAKAQLKEDNEEADSQIRNLMEQRNALKKQVEEREKDSQELRKKVNELEKQCKASQRKKSERERKAQQKRKERQSMKDDITKFEKESIDVGEDIKITERQELELKESHEKKMEEAHEQVEKAMVEAAGLEEQLREMGIKVKKLEETRENQEHRQRTADEEQAEVREREEAEASERNLQEQQTHYHALWSLVSQAEIQGSELLERLRWLLEQKTRDPTKFFPMPGLDYPPSGLAYGKRPRPRGAGLAMHRANHPAYGNSASPSPTLAQPLTFTPLNSTLGGFSPMSQQDLANHLTAGAPMSPTADTLLPSDLLGDDDDRVMPFGPVPPRLRTNSIPQVYRSGSREVSGANQDPSSPISASSQSPSLVSSPQRSLTNINRFYGTETLGDDETRSIGSANSPFAAPLPAPTTGGGSKKITNLLWFNRQRDKTVLDELPALGSLKSRESQSFPSNSDTREPASANRKGPGGIFNPANTPFGFFNRANKAPAEDVLTSGSTRPRRRGLLGSKSDPVDALTHGSSRPSSTYSFDQVPGAVIEGRFGWTTPESSRARPGPWAQQSSSRRQSIQHGSTSNLSLNSTPLDPPDSAAGGIKTQPAPIGTERFKIRQRSRTPRLNPNAPSFTTRLLNRGANHELKKKSSEVGSDKGKSRDGADKDKLREVDALGKSSPPIARLSQDGYSIATSVSISESHDSLEPTTSSAAHSEAAVPSSTSGSAPKESLMQRITRKSSSSMFSVPWSKSSRKEPSTPGDLEEDPDGDYLGRGSSHLADSLTSTPPTANEKTPGRGSRSWGRVMGKGRKKSELNMSDAGERSSETGDGVDLDEE